MMIFGGVGGSITRECLCRFPFSYVPTVSYLRSRVSDYNTRRTDCSSYLPYLGYSWFLYELSSTTHG